MNYSAQSEKNQNELIIEIGFVAIFLIMKRIDMYTSKQGSKFDDFMESMPEDLKKI